VMKRLAPGSGASEFQRPGGVVRLTVCAESGALVGKKCPHPIKQDFARGDEPTERCGRHQGRFKSWFRKLLGRDEDT